MSKDKELSKLFEKYSGKSPGCVVAIIDDGEVVYQKGFGKACIEHDVDINEETVFHVASVSKQFTAFAVMLLVENGKVNLDDDIRKYISDLLPEYEFPITIKHLLTHTSGLRDQFDLLELAGWRIDDDLITDNDILNIIRQQKKLNFKPGEQFSYCNTGFTLLSVIVERVSGLSFAQYTEQFIFKPLGMNFTHFHSDHKKIVKNKAYGYSGSKEKATLRTPNFSTVGATGLHTNIKDLILWVSNFEEFKIGNEMMLSKMTTENKLSDGEDSGYGLGFFVGKHKGFDFFEHAGGDGGFRSQLIYFVNMKVAIIILANTDEIFGANLSRQVADIYFSLNKEVSETGKKLQSSNEKTDNYCPDTNVLNKISGAYRNILKDYVSILEIKDGKLFDTGYELIPVSENTFKLKDFPVLIEWKNLEDENNIEMHYILETNKRIISKKMPPVDSDLQLNEYSGEFLSDEINTSYLIEVIGKSLYLQRHKFPPALLTPIYKDSFVNKGQIIVDETITLHFLRDDNNLVCGLSINTGRIRNIEFVKETKK
jgi:CubicO group peptidase (beta-lactamase class C family)